MNRSMSGRDPKNLRAIALTLATTASWLWSAPVASEETAVCTQIPVFEDGRVSKVACPDRLEGGFIPIDLGDQWAPAIFSEAPGVPQPYRPTFVSLANEQIDMAGPVAQTARRDRYFELFGIFPSFSIVRQRLLDEVRHQCHRAIDDGPLRAVKKTLAPWTAVPGGRPSASAAAISTVQQHLRCEGVASARMADGVFDAATQEALSLYQRRYMLPSAAVVDSETRAVLLTDPRELDFRTLLRALRERVADAAGLIEDGSASNAWEPVLGRFIDSSEYRRVLRSVPLQRGAPDLLDRATESAATALGWVSPEAAARALSGVVPPRVAVRLPPAPAYQRAASQFRVEIDRGDVWTSYPYDAEGRARRSPAKNRPTFTLYVVTDDGEIPLVRWPTTIGAWKSETIGDDEGLRYKASPVGRFYWRDLVVAPAWFPPPTTPDHELVHREGDGSWGADKDAVGPGYRSAYGLVALLHDRAVPISGGATLFADIEIRTHGSGNYRSILRGSSHGCHRLFNHLAIRLGSFLLAHHGHDRDGSMDQRYQRTLHWKGRAFRLHAESRGYRYELTPPIPVDVLPGRIVRSRSTPATPGAATPPAAPPASSPLPQPQT